MILYLTKTALCLLLLLAFYHLVLEREKMHQFNRFYLLGSVLFSFLVPFFTIYTSATTPVLEAFIPQNNQFPSLEPSAKVMAETPINYTLYFVILYTLISGILLLRFGWNLYQIIQKIRKNTCETYQKAILVLVDDKILPHTFLHYIFINKKDYAEGKIETELFTHELTHVTQKHTLDVLFIELLHIVFWFNPLIILLKKAIKLNHEFLADNSVIASHNNISKYQYLLLNKAAWNNTYYLASNLNYSLTKKRLLMMTTQKSRSKILLKKLILLPLLTGFILLFANKVAAQVTVNKTKKEKTEEQLYKEYVNRNAYITYKDKTGKKVTKAYNDLTEKEKKSFKAFTPPLISKKKIPTKKQLNNYKSKSKYAIWIDGKVVDNSVLNNYKNTDFSNFFDSFVYKNARSKRFPQTHQVHLSTNAYFVSQNNKRVKEFNEWKKFRNIMINAILKTKKLTKKSPSRKQLNEIKNPNVFKIFLDNKRISNSELEKLKLKDIAYFSGRCFITKKARSKKNPQAFFCTLYTHTYFDKHKLGEQKR